ncbi:MAG: DUF1517 domain-containing protein [Planctomycetes bacterium]|nr:DUF1517 domain-containing protein [Planctomycetota bacterium]
MKAKRRQELRANDLAHTIEELRRSFKDWGMYVIGAIAVVGVGFAIVSYMKSARNTAMADSYVQLQANSKITSAGIRKSDDELHRSLDRIGDLGDRSTDPAFKVSALIRQADLALNLAMTGEEGVDDSFLSVARKAFEAVVRDHKNRPLQYGRALYGLFQVEANAFAIDNDASHREAAEAHLQKLRDDSRLVGTPFQTMAIDKLNELDEIFTLVTFAKRPEATIQAVISPESGISPEPGTPSASVTIGAPAKEEDSDKSTPPISQEPIAPEQDAVPQDAVPQDAAPQDTATPEAEAPAPAEPAADAAEAGADSADSAKDEGSDPAPTSP